MIIQFDLRNAEPYIPSGRMGNLMKRHKEKLIECVLNSRGKSWQDFLAELPPATMPTLSIPSVVISDKPLEAIQQEAQRVLSQAIDKSAATLPDLIAETPAVDIGSLVARVLENSAIQEKVAKLKAIRAITQTSK